SRASPRLHLDHGLSVGLPPRDPGLPDPRPAPVRDRLRQRQARPRADERAPGPRAAVDPGFPRLRLRPPGVRGEGGPGADPGRGGGGRDGMDALEPPEPLHGRRAPARSGGGDPPGEGPVTRLGAARALALSIAAATLALGAGSRPLGAAEALAPNELGRVMI